MADEEMNVYKSLIPKNESFYNKWKEKDFKREQSNM